MPFRSPVREMPPQSSNDCSPSRQRTRPRSWLAIIAVSVFTAALSGDSLTAADLDMTEVRYAGVLSEAGGDTDGILRRFESVLLSSPGRDFFLVIDDQRSGCPWPESFGLLPADNQAHVVQPHLMYSYDGVPVAIHLPPLKLALPAEIAPGYQWRSGSWTFEAVATRTDGGQQVWQIAGSERRGRRQQLTVDAESNFLTAATLDVFMGRGDQFVLTLKQSSNTALPESEAAYVADRQTELLQLWRDLGRRPDSEQYQLTARQVERLQRFVDQLPDQTVACALSELQQRIQTDLTRQQARLQAGTIQAGRMVGQPAPEFSLNLIDGRTLDSAAMRGTTTVLHFWDYRDQPLSEPYGQTGYLEFLNNQQQQAGNQNRVRVVGVSTNLDFQTVDTIGRARRSARKLAEFMNLSYEIGYDDGALLRSLGDPRDAAGSLPLWVVISPNGRITHYHAGHYEVDPRDGLKELRQQLTTAE
jgi:peroxiredoxin